MVDLELYIEQLEERYDANLEQFLRDLSWVLSEEEFERISLELGCYGQSRAEDEETE
jgi:hypothetical protein